MKIGIDIGHNCRFDTGAVDIVSEDICNMQVGTNVITKLRSLGHEVVYCQPINPESTQDSLYQRTKIANDADVDIYCSIHFNSGGGTGTEVYAMSEEGRKIAARISEAISAALNLKNRGVKDGSHLYVIDHTNMPAVLVECLFIDNSEDVAKYNVELISNAIVKGLVGAAVSVSPKVEEHKEEKPAANVEIQKLQRLLNKLKIRDYEGKSLEVDGDYGSRTKSAVRLLQKILGITIDGEYGPETVGSINKVIEKPLQSVDSYNATVARYIQYRVGAEIDGNFGPHTKAKVIEFQLENDSLEPDGIVGPMTWSALLEK